MTPSKKAAAIHLAIDALDFVLSSKTGQLNDARIESCALAKLALQAVLAHQAQEDVMDCTDCDGTGITTQTERQCSCDASAQGEG